MTFEGQRNLYIRRNQPLLARLKIFVIHFFEKDQSFLVIYGQSINQDGMLSMDWWDELAFASSITSESKPIKRSSSLWLLTIGRE